MADSNLYFLSTNASGAVAAEQDIAEVFGGSFINVSMSASELDALGQRFTLPEEVFPMQEIMAAWDSTGDAETKFWCAKVVSPTGETIRNPYLVLATLGAPTLWREFSTVSHRYLATVPCDEGEASE